MNDTHFTAVSASACTESLGCAARLDVLLRIPLADDDKDAEREGECRPQQAQREAHVDAEARHRQRSPAICRLSTRHTHKGLTGKKLQ